MNQPFRDNFYLNIINQVFEIDKKAKKITEQTTLGRNIDKLKEIFAELGFEYHDPIGEKYSDSRSDCEASISGQSTKDLAIVETIKPIIRYRRDGYTTIVQKAVVVVESN
jgi:hypothetical protein